MFNMEGVVYRPLKANLDDRGWLAEIFRRDELPDGIWPEMAYISYTRQGVWRGPHEHVQQTDLFCFMGRFRIKLWDNRVKARVTEEAVTNSCVLLVPPGVVHAYRALDPEGAFVINCPNRLYAGWERKELVDEIRYEHSHDPEYQVNSNADPELVQRELEQSLPLSFRHGP